MNRLNLLTGLPMNLLHELLALEYAQNNDAAIISGDAFAGNPSGTSTSPPGSLSVSVSVPASLGSPSYSAMLDWYVPAQES